MDNFISEPYIMNISDVIFDTTISTFNRVHNESEYQKTLISLEKIGQTDPIYMDNGYCIDGRHRCKALAELGSTTVTAIDINPSMTMDDKLTLANKDLTSGRDITKSQLAIQAYKYAKLTGVGKVVTALKFGVDKRMLTYASEVKQYLPDAYNSIEKIGKASFDDGKYTQSLEALYKYINKVVKHQDKTITDKGAAMPDYNKQITTEQGKELFWEVYNIYGPGSDLAEHLIKYVNMRFAIDESSD